MRRTHGRTRGDWAGLREGGSRRPINGGLRWDASRDCAREGAGVPSTGVFDGMRRGIALSISVAKQTLRWGATDTIFAFFDHDWYVQVECAVIGSPISARRNWDGVVRAFGAASSPTPRSASLSRDDCLGVSAVYDIDLMAAMGHWWLHLGAHGWGIPVFVSSFHRMIVCRRLADSRRRSVHASAYYKQ